MGACAIENVSTFLESFRSTNFAILRVNTGREKAAGRVGKCESFDLYYKPEFVDPIVESADEFLR